MLQLWAYGNRVYWDDYIADQNTQAFLRQCEREGRLTAKEFACLSLGKSTTGYSKPHRLIRYADFVRAIGEDMNWPEEDVRRCLTLHLEAADLPSQHLEFYLNYPAWKMADLAEIFDVSPTIVGLGIRRVRRAWPALRFDGTKIYGVPDLARMMGFYRSRQADDTEFNVLDCFPGIAVCGRFSTEGQADENDSTGE